MKQLVYFVQVILPDSVGVPAFRARYFSFVVVSLKASGEKLFWGSRQLKTLRAHDSDNIVLQIVNNSILPLYRNDHDGVSGICSGTCFLENHDFTGTVISGQPHRKLSGNRSRRERKRRWVHFYDHFGRIFTKM